MYITHNGQVMDDGSYMQGGLVTGLGGMSGSKFNPALYRPYVDNNGVPCVTLNVGYKNGPNGERIPQPRKIPISELRSRGIDVPVWNATSLRKEQWVAIDNAVKRVTRLRLKAWMDLQSRSSVGGFDAYGHMTYEYEAVNDPGEAVVDMDVLADGRTDEPSFILRSLPLPITHSDFYFSDRRLAVSGNRGTPVDTFMAEAAARRVAEMVEKTLIGTVTGTTYGTRSIHDGSSKVYGYTNFPNRITKTDLTTPTGSNPEAVMTDILEMIELLQADGFYGPYGLYHSTGYSRYLNDDYFRSGSTSAVRSLRERIMAIEGIEFISRLDYLTSGYQLILVQFSSDVVQAVNGMDTTVVQWESQGGLRHNFKVMTIKVPLFRSDYNSNCGLVHGTTS